MAVTNEFSTEYLKATDPRTNGYLGVNESHAGLRMQRFNFTQGVAAGDAASTMTLFKLPAGRLLWVPALSYISWDAFGAARTLDIGYAAFTAEDGSTTSADTNAADAAIDVSGAGAALMGSDLVIGDADGIVLNSTSGVDILATVAGGTIPAATKLIGHLVFAFTD